MQVSPQEHLGQPILFEAVFSANTFYRGGYGGQVNRGAVTQIDQDVGDLQRCGSLHF
jgi:hypothetical protein